MVYKYAVEVWTNQATLCRTLHKYAQVWSGGMYRPTSTIISTGQIWETGNFPWLTWLETRGDGSEFAPGSFPDPWIYYNRSNCYFATHPLLRIWWDNNWEIHNKVFRLKWCDKKFTICCNHNFGIQYAIKEQHILIPLINSAMVAELISVQQNMGRRSRGHRKYGQGWRSKRCLKTELCLDQSSNIPIFCDTAFAIAYFVPQVSDIWGIQGSAPQKRGLSNPIFYLWSGTCVRLTPPVRPPLIA